MTQRAFVLLVPSLIGAADIFVQTHRPGGVAAEGRPRPIPANPPDYATGYLLAFESWWRCAAAPSRVAVRHVCLAGSNRTLAPRLSPFDPYIVLTQQPDLRGSRLDSLMTAADTPFGRLRYLTPVAQLSDTPGRWDLPTRPLDHDAPEWW
jgi:hypothetical protein